MGNPISSMLIGVCFILGLVLFALPMFIMSLIDIVNGVRFLNAIDMCVNVKTIVSPTVWMIVIGSVTLFLISMILVSLYCMNVFNSPTSRYVQITVLVSNISYLIFSLVWSIIGAIGHFAATCPVSDI